VVQASGVKPPLKTGILPYLRQRGIDIHSRVLKATSFQFHDSSLIFVGLRNERTELYSLRLSSSFEPRGEPMLLYKDSNSQDSPSLLGNLLAFNSVRSDLNVWRVPLREDAVQGEPVKLTDSTEEAVFPTVSADGGQLLYLTLQPPMAQVWKKDLVTGIESELYRAIGVNRLKATSSGTKAFFRVMEGAPPQPQAIYSIDVAKGTLAKVCANCGSPTSASPSGDYVVHETGSVVPRLAVIHVPTQQRREFLRHPHHGVQAGRLSPDGRWIAFELDRGPDGVQLFLAAFRGLDPISESDWIPLTDPSVSSYEPAWSSDGSAVYFLSDRSGSRDLWMQPLQASKKPLGSARLVRSFPNPHLTPLTYHGRHPRYVGLSISAHDAVLTLSELTSSIWLAQLSR
jgi:Tol biopolymer transport system component